MDSTQIYAITLGAVEVILGSVLVGAHCDDFDESVRSIILVLTPLALQLPLFGRVFGWW